jgi:serine-type D-Ala-D-Ala carboxypeptidase/endopeptidase (penicillin-binding protein 4)
MKNWSVVILVLIFWNFSCSPISKRSLDKTFKSTDERFKDHTGFALYDLDKKKSVYEYRSGHYFTPASNTKIFTLFSCLTLLGDSVPALKYVATKDSLIFWGTGDPTFLYKEVYDNNRIYSFLGSSTLPLYFSDTNFQTIHWGPGWAWDDYNDYYSAERSAFPIYGNIMTLQATGRKFSVQPPF